MLRVFRLIVVGWFGGWLFWLRWAVVLDFLAAPICVGCCDMSFPGFVGWLGLTSGFLTLGCLFAGG